MDTIFFFLYFPVAMLKALQLSLTNSYTHTHTHTCVSSLQPFDASVNLFESLTFQFVAAAAAIEAKADPQGA